MRKIHTRTIRKFRALHINRDVYDELTAIIAKDCEKMYVSLRDAEFEFSSLSEIEKRPGTKIESLGISGHGPYVTLSVGRTRMGGWLWDTTNSLWSDDDDRARAVFLKLESVLAERQRWIGRVINWRWYWVLAVANLATMYAPFVNFLNTTFGPNTKHRFELFMLGYFLVFLLCTWRGLTVIDLRPVDHTRGFWRQNQEKIILSIISAVIGSALTVLARKLFP